MPSHLENAWLVPILLCSRQWPEAHLEVVQTITGEEGVRWSTVYDGLATTVSRLKPNWAFVGTAWSQSSRKMPNKYLTLYGNCCKKPGVRILNAKDLQGCHWALQLEDFLMKAKYEVWKCFYNNIIIVCKLMTDFVNVFAWCDGIYINKVIDIFQTYKKFLVIPNFWTVVYIVETIREKQVCMFLTKGQCSKR